MSAQSKAKAAQGYDPKPEPNRCATCGHFKSDFILPEWMIKANSEAPKRLAPLYTLDDNAIEKNARCGLGGFAVKKTAVCQYYIQPVSA
ncbi:hypothetical protein [Massilia pseudoviolaceinigra]|uniref:hypothetical protein n=1 Tax=Massilia pseudoviolaceinigra TaxID=3057165 RepID=UPI002796A8FF|nr:hypothetical protein [Massilia sp. CCM 9206]MDQ1921670.1 hypothetical protein [Massilia sp. CCM 9206]